ncbi:hypothetical protein LEMLEM_LOCUS16557 [Lemmus lemmus]
MGSVAILRTGTAPYVWRVVLGEWRSGDILWMLICMKIVHLTFTIHQKD